MEVGILRQIETLIGGIGVILSTFFAVFLLGRRKALSNIFLAIYLFAFALRVGKSIFHNYYEISEIFRNFVLSLLYCVGPSIWLFSKYLNQSHIKIKWPDVLHYGLFILMIPFYWWIPNDNSNSGYFNWFYFGSSAHIFTYILISLLHFRQQEVQHRLAKSKEIRKWWLKFLLVNLGFLVWYLLVSIPIIPFYLGISFLYSLMIGYLSFHGMKSPEVFATPKEKYRDSNLDIHQAKNIVSQIKAVMEGEKRYLDHSLSLANLGKEIGVSSKEISQAINQIEQINFSQYLSRYRLEEAKKLLHSPDHTHLKIAAIAYESGFNSLSSFNAQFKKQEKMTASEYQNQHAN